MPLHISELGEVGDYKFYFCLSFDMALSQELMGGYGEGWPERID